MPWNTSEYINRADSMHFLLWLLCQDQGFCPRLFSPPNRFAAVIGSPRKTCQRRTCQLIPLRTHKMQRSVLDNASEDQTKQVHLLMKLPCPGPSLLNGEKSTQNKSQNQMRPEIQKETQKPRLECWRTYSTCFLASLTSLSWYLGSRSRFPQHVQGSDCVSTGPKARVRFPSHREHLHLQGPGWAMERCVLKCSLLPLQAQGSTSYFCAAISRGRRRTEQQQQQQQHQHQHQGAESRRGILFPCPGDFFSWSVLFSVPCIYPDSMLQQQQHSSTRGKAIS